MKRFDIMDAIGPAPSRTEGEAEAAGYDAAINGPNTGNCHFAFFATPEKTKAWERGNARGKSEKE